MGTVTPDEDAEKLAEALAEERDALLRRQEEQRRQASEGAERREAFLREAVVDPLECVVEPFASRDFASGVVIRSPGVVEAWVAGSRIVVKVQFWDNGSVRADLNMEPSTGEEGLSYVFPDGSATAVAGHVRDSFVNHLRQTLRAEDALGGYGQPDARNVRPFVRNKTRGPGGARPRQRPTRRPGSGR